MVTPGESAICEGTVRHRRNSPAIHQFTNPVSMIWCDPDEVDELFRSHLLCSTRRPALVRFRRSDYGVEGTPVSSDDIRDTIAEAVGERPDGPVRMLTQPRRLGWLFNPITVYVAWNKHGARPMGAVAEVTNTPWKERHRYAMRLEHVDGVSMASFDKTLHVSPFLHEDYRYVLRLEDSEGDLLVDLDVIDPDSGEPIVETAMRLTRLDPTRSNLTRFALRRPLATLRVSAGIHLQAIRLIAKRVPFISHPSRRPVESPSRKITTS